MESLTANMETKNENNKELHIPSCSNFTNDTDNDIKYCMTNLKILGRIQPKDKLYFKENTFFISKKTATQGLSRWYKNGSRKDTINKLEEFILKLFNTIDTIYNTECGKEQQKSLSNNYYLSLEQRPRVFKQENSNLLIIFTNEINKCISGITNLKQTYKSDIATVSSLEIIIEKLSVREKKISEVLSVNNMK